MSILCFGSFARLLKDATSLSNESLINLLFDCVNPSKGKYGTTLGSPDQSKLINSKFEVPLYITEPADTPAVIGSSEDYFRDKVIIQIKKVKLNALLSSLTRLINEDGSISVADKKNFLLMANEKQLSAFLSSVYLYAVQQQNNLAIDPLPVTANENIITYAAGKLYIGNDEVKLPTQLSPPKDFENHESVYIGQLLLAYAEAEGVPAISHDAIPKKYQCNFNEQRQHYFNAEGVRRRVRDVFPPDRDEFEILKSETYDGVIDIHSQDWTHGYERLLKVLAQSALIRIEKSLLGSQLTWIGSSEKKGICHILVNDGRIKWVVKEDE